MRGHSGKTFHSRAGPRGRTRPSRDRGCHPGLCPSPIPAPPLLPTASGAAAAGRRGRLRGTRFLGGSRLCPAPRGSACPRQAAGPQTSPAGEAGAGAGRDPRHRWHHHIARASRGPAAGSGGGKLLPRPPRGGREGLGVPRLPRPPREHEPGGDRSPGAAPPAPPALLPPAPPPARPGPAPRCRLPRSGLCFSPLSPRFLRGGSNRSFFFSFLLLDSTSPPLPPHGHALRLYPPGCPNPIFSSL